MAEPEKRYPLASYRFHNQRVSILELDRGMYEVKLERYIGKEKAAEWRARGFQDSHAQRLIRERVSITLVSMTREAMEAIRDSLGDFDNSRLATAKFRTNRAYIRKQVREDNVPWTKGSRSG